jgi:hypothetical protein
LSFGAVDTIDFKGQYGFEVKDPEALGALYDRVLGPDGRAAGQPPGTAPRRGWLPLDDVASPRATVIVARGAVDRRTGQNGEGMPAVPAFRCGHRLSEGAIVHRCPSTIRLCRLAHALLRQRTRPAPAAQHRNDVA